MFLLDVYLVIFVYFLVSLIISFLTLSYITFWLVWTLLSSKKHHNPKEVASQAHFLVGRAMKSSQSRLFSLICVFENYITSRSDIAGEIKATLAVASITFKDDYSYYNKILQDAALTQLRG